MQDRTDIWVVRQSLSSTFPPSDFSKTKRLPPLHPLCPALQDSANSSEEKKGKAQREAESRQYSQTVRRTRIPAQNVHHRAIICGQSQPEKHTGAGAVGRSSAPGSAETRSCMQRERTPDVFHPDVFQSRPPLLPLCQCVSTEEQV